MANNITILIPARNEASNIKILLPALFKNYNSRINEIILINDCSTDNTRKILKNLQKVYSKLNIINRTKKPGVGNALMEGIKNINPQSEYILFMDCDFLANINDVGLMIKNISNFDGIVGSRFIRKNSLISYPLLKKIVNRSYHLLSRLLLNTSNSDLTNNFKLYKASLVRQICPFLSASDFAINAQLGFYPVLMHAKLGELPVSWQERTGNMGLSKFKIFKVGPSYLKVFVDLLRYKYLPSQRSERT